MGIRKENLGPICGGRIETARLLSLPLLTRGFFQMNKGVCNGLFFFEYADK